MNPRNDRERAEDFWLNVWTFAAAAVIVILIFLAVRCDRTPAGVATPRVAHQRAIANSGDSK